MANPLVGSSRVFSCHLRHPSSSPTPVPGSNATVVRCGCASRHRFIGCVPAGRPTTNSESERNWLETDPAGSFLIGVAKDTERVLYAASTENGFQADWGSMATTVYSCHLGGLVSTLSTTQW